MNDVRYALRMMHRSRGFTAVAVLSLALGPGAPLVIGALTLLAIALAAAWIPARRAARVDPMEALRYE